MKKYSLADLHGPRKFFRLSAVAFVAAEMFAVGCGRGDVCHVSGKIAYRGVPLTHGVINFIGPDNQPLGGAVGGDGTYACDVPPGTYDVIIVAPGQLPEDWREGQPPPEMKPEVPEKYNQRQTSGLQRVVSDREQTLDFDLQ
jgi:hypothetical protein